VGAKKIKGKKSLILRIRVKKYRILYKIDIKEKRIMILAVSQRKDIYKKI
jgi:mRNA-degrading endonuclease RelE of RelBE toxin-antitoxin system